MPERPAESQNSAARSDAAAADPFPNRETGRRRNEAAGDAIAYGSANHRDISRSKASVHYPSVQILIIIFIFC